ncbi:hypothetical protein QR680_015781 [Steinernema hermaphroditum]|uniref:Uncharacterized protein n=1 Tax=Steinernema hermaphroditum TaxID=289476 RepID=A0AA39LLH0_9BILA|nr:hypothetical protein QR680_015781 [Steinernema hermaphroditum]
MPKRVHFATGCDFGSGPVGRLGSVFRNWLQAQPEAEDNCKRSARRGRTGFADFLSSSAPSSYRSPRTATNYPSIFEQLRASWTIIMLIIIAVMPIPIWFIWIALQCYRHSRKLHSNMQEEV